MDTADFLLTVEQVELIKRLRSTGITPERIARVFEKMELLELELNTWNNLQQRMAHITAGSGFMSTPFCADSISPNSPLPLRQGFFSTQLANDVRLNHEGAPVPALDGLASCTPALRALRVALALSQGMTGKVRESQLPRMPPPRTEAFSPDSSYFSYSLADPTTAMASQVGEPKQLEDLLRAIPSLPLLAQSSANNQSSPTSSVGSDSSAEPNTGAINDLEENACYSSLSQQAPIIRDIITLDDPRELDEFMLQGEMNCIDDMRQFISQFALRQTTVALMTGVSQPYISKLLNGNHRELSLRCRKNIYSWYLNCRQHPEKLATFVRDPTTRLETNKEGELIPQRRERYVFRPVLIGILERSFLESPFPDAAKRTEIANACNDALSAKRGGNKLAAREIVTPQVVANWFANRRKEVRRRQPTQALSAHPPTESTPLDCKAEQFHINAN